MSCSVKVDLEKVEVNSALYNNEPGNDEYSFRVTVNGITTRHPASGNYTLPGFGIFQVNKNVYNEVVETDTVNLFIFVRVIEDDTFFDDVAIAQIILKLPSKDLISMSVSFDAISFDSGLLGTSATIGKVFFNIVIQPITPPPIP